MIHTSYRNPCSLAAPHNFVPPEKLKDFRKIMHDHVILKCFNLHIDNHVSLYTPNIAKEIRQASVSIIKSLIEPEATSLDAALLNAQYLSKSQQIFHTVISTLILQICSGNKVFLMLQRFDFFLNIQVRLIGTFPVKELQKKQTQLRDLFFKTLKDSEYDRGLIAPKSSLETVLDPTVSSSHDNNDKIDPVTGKRIKGTILEIQFSCRLGVKPEVAPSDYHSIYFLLDRSKKRLGVFKPAIQEDDPMGDCYGASEDREAHLAESANSTLDQYLNTKLVPHTQLLTIDLPLNDASHTFTGSFQFYVDNAGDLFSLLEGENLFDENNESLAKRLDYPANQKLTFLNLEEFAFLDFLTGNNDHHFKNILVQKVTADALNLVAIDNANSFPWCHHLDLPTYKIPPKHWFKWITLPHAQKPFSTTMIDRINAIDFKQLEAVVRNQLVHKDTPSSQDHIQGKMTTLEDRFNIIKQLANQKTLLKTIAKAILSLTKKTPQEHKLTC